MSENSVDYQDLNARNTKRLRESEKDARKLLDIAQTAVKHIEDDLQPELHRIMDQYPEQMTNELRTELMRLATWWHGVDGPDGAVRDILQAQKDKRTGKWLVANE